ncbi:MAG: cysteine desulfurase family protein [Flavobacteriaceae bacterium]|nr:cysteine desulfurase family protein [Flavobacteriaceae bacterium]
MQVYFDNAATTPLYPEVIQKVTDVLEQYYGNPSSIHSIGRKSRTIIELARKEISSYLGAKPQEIIFNSGGTEGINFIFHSAINDLKVKRIITSKIEHHAVLECLPLNQKKIDVQYVTIHSNGLIDLDSLEHLLAKKKTKTLVSLMHVNNEIGTITDLKKCGEICAKYQSLFHTDAVQSVGKLSIDVKECLITFLTASAHKFHGPKGTGFLYIERNSGIKAQISGGGQERGLRAGTESVHNILGMSLALKLSYQQLDQNTNHISQLKTRFLNRLKEIFNDLIINGIENNEQLGLPHICHVTFPIPKKKAQLLGFKLDMKGIACSQGSACQSGTPIGSHVLDELSNDSKDEFPSFRFSFSKFNTIQEVDYVLASLEEIANN